MENGIFVDIEEKKNEGWQYLSPNSIRTKLDCKFLKRHLNLLYLQQQFDTINKTI